MSYNNENVLSKYKDLDYGGSSKSVYLLKKDDSRDVYNSSLRFVVDFNIELVDYYHEYDNDSTSSYTSSDEGPFSNTKIEECILVYGRENMFRNCKNLKHVVIMSDLDEYSRNPPNLGNFHWTDLMRRATIWKGRQNRHPSGHATYTYNTFYSQSPDDSGRMLRPGMFTNCTSIQCAYIPLSIIDRDVFSGCTNLRQIVVTENLTTIRERAFKQCISLPSITGPTSLTTIEGAAFFACTGLTSVNLPNVTSIGNAAFGACNYLVSLICPNVSTIGREAFNTCTRLTSVNLPNVSTIGQNAFSNTGLTTVSLPANCTYYANSFPSGCTVTGGTLIS